MANSELSKLKILFIYDYFKKNLGVGDLDAVSVSVLIGSLEQMTGTTFERKSIYADINKINEYVQKSGQTTDDSWIFTEGKKYKRSDLKDEITIDEARLIVDAISTTTFVDSDLCEKIMKMFPAYFSDSYRNRMLYPHYEKVDSRSILKLNNIRRCIDEESALKFNYGYMLGGELTEKTEKIVSPMALDWENNCYYLIAIDNEKGQSLEKDQNLSAALKRYRVDRMTQLSYTNHKYINYKSKRIKEQEIKRFVDNSLSAYASSRKVPVDLTIIGKTRKDVLKAYGAFDSRMRHDIRINDDTKLDKGILKINVMTGDVPTLYTDLFELSTFDDVTVTIENEEICNKYAEYIKKAAKAAKLSKL